MSAWRFFKIMVLFYLFLSGLISGIIGGMGMGGGTLLIPALIVFFNVSAHSAAAINLISFIPTAVVSVIIHVKNGLIEFKDVLLIAAPALLSCVAAFYISRALDPKVLARVFGWFLLSLAAISAFDFIKKL